MVDKIIMEEDWVGEGGSISNCLGGGGASSAGNSLTHHWMPLSLDALSLSRSEKTGSPRAKKDVAQPIWQTSVKEKHQALALILYLLFFKNA